MSEDGGIGTTGEEVSQGDIGVWEGRVPFEALHKLMDVAIKSSHIVQHEIHRGAIEV